MTRKITEAFRQYYRGHKSYFSGAQDEIAATNLHSLRVISSAATFLILFFIALTPLIVKTWTPTIEYLLFAPCNAVFAFYSVLCCRHRKLSPKEITTASVLYFITLMAFMITIDVFPYPNGAASLTPIFLAICSAVFILPNYILFPCLFGSDLIFILLTHAYKPALLAQNDTFSALLASACGLLLSASIMNIRITDHKIKTNYRDLSETDGLTGLYNKFTCENKVRDYLSSRELDDDCVLMIVDLDNFKQINDRLGHHTGDLTIQGTATILKNLFRPDDIIGRFGGDEFIVLLKHINHVNFIDQKCKNINSAVQALLPEEKDFHITCSIGIAKTIGDYISYDDMFRLADDALYEAKNFGKNQYVMHIPQPSITGARYPHCMLVVDDSDIIRAAIRETFRDSFEIIKAESGHEALSMLSQYAKQISVVLLDIHMDDLDGYEVLHYMKARTHTQRIPVVMITSNADNEEKALLYGADDMVKKPLDSNVMKLRVNNVLRRSKL